MRNEDGLIEGLDHPKTEEGFVDWRAMVNPDQLYVNREYFEKRGLDVPDSVEGLEDNQLVMKLGGLKELARLRGFTSCTTKVKHIDKDYVTATCSIHWIGNYETSGKCSYFSANCGVNARNADDFALRFIETTAENRAFTRCVRNFLNIHIVGDEELTGQSVQANQEPQVKHTRLSGFGPHAIFDGKARELGLNDFDLVKGWLRTLYKTKVYVNDDAANWSKIEDIPVKEIRKLMTYLSAGKPEEEKVDGAE